MPLDRRIRRLLLSRWVTAGRAAEDARRWEEDERAAALRRLLEQAARLPGGCG